MNQTKATQDELDQPTMAEVTYKKHIIIHLEDVFSMHYNEVDQPHRVAK